MTRAFAYGVKPFLVYFAQHDDYVVVSKRRPYGLHCTMEGEDVRAQASAFFLMVHRSTRYRGVS